MDQVSIDSFDEYQEYALRTSKFQAMVFDPNCQSYPADPARAAVAGLGLAGEAGEICDILKKYIGHTKPFDQQRIMDEAGDLLWYLTELSSACGFTLKQLAEHNVAKLAARHGNTYSESFYTESK